MIVTLEGHRLLPDDKMPKNPDELVRILQRAMPYELFDPNEHAFETIVSVAPIVCTTHMQIMLLLAVRGIKKVTRNTQEEIFY